MIIILVFSFLTLVLFGVLLYKNMEKYKILGELGKNYRREIREENEDVFNELNLLYDTVRYARRNYNADKRRTGLGIFRNIAKIE